MFSWLLYVKVIILLATWKHLYDRIWKHLYDRIWKHLYDRIISLYGDVLSEPIKLALFYLKCLYQAGKMSGHIFVC